MAMLLTPTPTQGDEDLQKTRKHLARRHSHDSPKMLQRTWSKRRLRRLVVADRSSKERAHRKQELEVSRGKASHQGWYCLLLALCLGLGLSVGQWSMATSNFWEIYNKQYHSIVHNRSNYCDRSHRLGDMVTHCRREVLHQEEALNELERALDNDTFQAIALVGSSGVGKSHTARVLREQFPWPENVQTLSWSAPSSLLRVESMLNKIVQCGRNLILIDNMTPQDVQNVAVISDLIRGREDIASGTGQPDLKQLTVVFVFSVNRLQPEEIHDSEIETLIHLPRTHVITYAPLEPVHLIDCIRKEALIERVHLDEAHIDEIIRGSDAKASGCKSVRAKVLMYGRPIATQTDKETNSDDQPRLKMPQD